MSARDVTFTLMALSHVAGCRGESATEILAEAVGEIVRLQTERDRYKDAMDSLYSEALLCHNHGVKLQFVQFVLSKTVHALEYKEGRNEQV